MMHSKMRSRMTDNRLIIAIDGPAGSGKSTAGKMLARRLKYRYIDTGAMYRAIAYACKNRRLDPEISGDRDELINETDKNISFLTNGDEMLITYNNKDITPEIRSEEIAGLASKISAYPSIRKKCLQIQRMIGKDGGVILDGRDIGTVVFPDADIKFFLTASMEERVRRRYDEIRDKRGYNDLESDIIREEIINRDTRDSSRVEAPLKIAHDSIVLDTTSLNIKEMINKMMELIEKSLKSK